MNTHNQYCLDAAKTMLTLQYGQFIMDIKKVPSLDIIRRTDITNLFLKNCYNNALENLEIQTTEYPTFEQFHKQINVDFKKINQLFEQKCSLLIEYFEIMELKKIKEANEKFHQLDLEIDELDSKENHIPLNKDSVYTDEEKMFRYLQKKERDIEANKQIDNSTSSCVIS